MEPLIITGFIALLVIFIFGIYFSYTDVTRRIIPNRLLLVFLVLGLALNGLVIFREPQIANQSFLVILLSVVIGLATYYLNLWFAGDSKLFIATAIYIIPFSVHSVTLVFFHLCLSLVICYCLLFILLLIKSVAKKKIKVVLIRATQTFVSAERFTQGILTYSLSLIVPLPLNVTVKTILLYLILYFIQSNFNYHSRGRLKVWHFYGIVSLSVLVYIKVMNLHLPLVNLLYLFGFIYFFNFYFSLGFFSQLTAISVDKLTAGMELGFNLYRIRGGIISNPLILKNTEIVLKAPKQLTDSDIGYLKGLLINQEGFDVPIRGTPQPIPFAPFIITSALFIITRIIQKL
jgi:Flp pilus assembly protein protease CpaA